MHSSSNAHTDLRINSKYKLLVDTPAQNRTAGTKNKSKKVRHYSLAIENDKEEEMASDNAPLLNSQSDSNFDEDDYLSERNRKNYGLYSGDSSGKKKDDGCCGKFIWCICGGCFQVCGR